MTAKEIEKILIALGNPEIAEHSQQFFKTGKGEYGEGDLFLGIRVPVIRKQLKTHYKDLTLSKLSKLLRSKYHEIRLFAVIALASKFKNADDKLQKEIYTLYLAHTKFINNWDIVDSSAHLIVGPYLENKRKAPLLKLAKSNSLWERRIAIMATLHYIKQNKYSHTLNIAKILLQDEHDLIHKAVGWMLREVGKRDFETENDFLVTHYQNMPRTMLRYAIEKFPENHRQTYLKGRV